MDFVHTPNRGKSTFIDITAYLHTVYYLLFLFYNRRMMCNLNFTQCD